MVESNFKINIQNLGVSYGSKVALRDISMDIEANEIFGIIGDLLGFFIRRENELRFLYFFIDIFKPGNWIKLIHAPVVTRL